MFGWNAVGFGGNSAYASAYLEQAAGARSMVPIGSVQPAQTTAVSPVPAVAAVQPDTAQAVPEQEGPQLPSQREGVDPVEWAVRGRIQYADGTGQAASEDAAAAEGQAASETKSAQEVMEESECQTCKERKYQDGSDDPGVSYKTPTNIAPEAAASAVRSHEQEHVSREQSKAQQEGREVVSQSVTIHTAICPECGRVYVSGGTTRTTTRQEKAAQMYQQQEQAPSQFQSVA
ncbi:hypothetical protein ACTQ34_02860 [Agathobaculum sp. LCP25S3_E8]|uniref:hypothetical protein n=1 Tax=Agathobaculum sp. LCP25S3_E8 TaxID=3438735 RepID=UPI003F91876C